MKDEPLSSDWMESIESAINALGKGLGLIWLLLMLVILVNVISRYLFNQGFIQLEELQWHLYATGFLLGLSFAVTQDVHVRVDVLRERWSPELRAWIEIYGILLLLLPFIVLVLVASWPFVTYSFTTSEISQAPGGLPLRWVIKSVLPLGFLLLALATVARLAKVGRQLFGAPNKAEIPSQDQTEVSS